MASLITLRLGPERRKRVARLARRPRTTTSPVLREAIATFVKRESTTPGYELIEDLIGDSRGGDPGRSARKLSEVLKARRRT